MFDQHVKEAASLMEQAKGALSQAGGAVAAGAGKLGDAAAAGMGQVKGLADSPDLKKLLPYLLAGGAGAVAGGALSGRRKTRAGETHGQYLARILRNAAVTGGLAGGGSYLAHKGFEKTLGSADLENPLTGKEGDQGPLATGTRGALFHPATAAAAGVGTLGATAGLKGIGANPNAGQHEKQLLSDIKSRGIKGVKSREDLVGLGRRDQAAFQATLGNNPETLRDARGAGINIHDPNKVTAGIKGLEHKTTEIGRLPSALLGRTAGRRVGRGALGLSASLLPALLGAVATSKPE